MNNNILLIESKVRFEAHATMTPDFPFIFHPYVTRSRKTFSLHENFELLYFLDGEGSMLYDGTRCPVRKGDIVAVNSYAPHHVITGEKSPHFCLIIGMDFCRYVGIDPNLLVFQRIIRDDAQATALFQQVMDAYAAQNDRFRNAEIKCAVLELLLFLCRRYSTPKTEAQLTQTPSLKYVHRAMGYMKANLSHKLSADEIAASVGLSKFHFLREFKRVTGYTLNHYLNTIRCEHARSLLESGQYTVKEAAFLCGFTNHSYFSNVFFKYIGMLPSQVKPQ